MKPKGRVTANAVETSFKINARRLKSELDKSQEFYWFYVSLHLVQIPNSVVSLSDLAVVDYHLRHESFPEPNLRITDPSNGFEYKFWLYGFIKVSATVVTKDGEVFELPATPIEWTVEPEELKRNGKRELSW